MHQPRASFWNPEPAFRRVISKFIAPLSEAVHSKKFNCFFRAYISHSDFKLGAGLAFLTQKGYCCLRQKIFKIEASPKVMPVKYSQISYAYSAKRVHLQLVGRTGF